MSAGSCIAIAALSLYVGIIVYGLSCDVRRWWKDRRDGLERAWELPCAPNPLVWHDPRRMP